MFKPDSATTSSTFAVTNAFVSQNRSQYLMAAVFMQLLLGITYAWSVFRGPLTQLYGWSSVQTIAPYQFVLLMVPAGSIIGGYWQDRKGPRLVATISGLLVGVGYLLAAWKGDTVRNLVLAYGVMTGLGIGFAYVASIAVCVKWFPDRRGAVVGLSAMGSGIGTVIYGPGLEALIGHDPTRLSETIPRAFLILSTVFFIGMIGAAQFFRVPPAGWKPSGWAPVLERTGDHEISSRKMLSTWQFYALWVLYFLGSAVGLTLIGEASILIQAMARTSALVSGGVTVGLMSIFNGVGRLSWGAVSDRLGRKATISIMGITCAIACLGLLLSTPAFWWVLPACLCLAAFGYGGYLAVMPSITADYYGPRNVGANYGLIFIAWGVSGFIVPRYFARLIDRARVAGHFAAGYHEMYWKLIALAILSSLIAAVLRPPYRDVRFTSRSPG